MRGFLEQSDTFSAAGQILIAGTLAADESGSDTAAFSTLARLAISIAHTRRIGTAKTIFSAGRVGGRRTYFAGRRIGPRRITGD